MRKVTNPRSKRRGLFVELLLTKTEYHGFEARQFGLVRFGDGLTIWTLLTNLSDELKDDEATEAKRYTILGEKP